MDSELALDEAPQPARHITSFNQRDLQLPGRLLRGRTERLALAAVRDGPVTCLLHGSQQRLRSGQTASVLPHEAQLAVQALVKKALYTFHSGDVQTAIRLNRQAMAILDQQLPTELWTTATRNQLVFLAAATRKLPFEHRSTD